MPSLLLSLPAELRLGIYEFLLDPSRIRDDAARTPTRISWIGYTGACPVFARYQPHEVGGQLCECSNTGSPWIPGRPAGYCTAILCASKAIYAEAMPMLYENRIFDSINFRTFSTQHEAMLERWWIMDRFLASLSAAARNYVRALSLPMLLSPYNTYGNAEAFRSFQSWLPELHYVEINAIYLDVLERIPSEDDEGAHEDMVSNNQPYKVHALLAFTHAEVKISPHKSAAMMSPADLQQLGEQAEAMRSKHRRRQLERHTDVMFGEESLHLQQHGL